MDLARTRRCYAQSIAVHRPPRPLSVRRGHVVTPPPGLSPRLKDVGNGKGKPTKVGFPRGPLPLFLSPLISTFLLRVLALSLFPCPRPGSTLRPTSVVRRNSKIVWVRRTSANVLWVPDLEAVLPPSLLSPNFRPHDLLLRLPAWAVLEQMLPRLYLVGHHPHIAVVQLLAHRRICPVRQCPVFTWWNQPAKLSPFLRTWPSCRSGAVCRVSYTSSL